MEDVIDFFIDDDFVIADEIDSLLEVDNDTLIVLYNDFKDEHKYIEKLLLLFQKMQESGKRYSVKIEIYNFELLKNSGLLNFSNINLLIDNKNFTPYTAEEFWRVDEKLEELVKSIKEANLSPYERFLAVYEIVKNYKPYKEYDEKDFEDAEVSRRLGNILFNDYIVCRGFANFLSALCNKVGIPVCDVGVKTRDVASDSNGAHSRNLIKLDDDKYNIHGVYLTDATWDNGIGLELYNNSAITFDRKKEADWMESLEDVDLLLDFHNMSDFTSKINFFLRRNMSKNNVDSISYAYSTIYEKILGLLSKLDYEKYMYFFNKYDSLLKRAKKEFFWSFEGKAFASVEKIYEDFLTEYAQYIIPLSNKKINTDTMLNALSEVKKQTKKYSLEELKAFREKIISDSENEARYAFPYVYDFNDSRLNYLESRDEQNGRSR